MPFFSHLSIFLIFLTYILIGSIIIHEIESGQLQTSSIINNSHRNNLVSKIIENRQMSDLEQYTRDVYKHIYQYEEQIRKQYNVKEISSWNFSKAFLLIITSITTTCKTYEIIFMKEVFNFFFLKIQTNLCHKQE